MAASSVNRGENSNNGGCKHELARCTTEGSWTDLDDAAAQLPFLVASIVVAAGMKLYIDKDAVARFLRRYEKGGVLGATAVAVTTPLCSCGTTALVLGMMAGSMPWAPIVAFMVASPLTSAEELFYSAGLFGWPFAIAFFAASILLGLMGRAILDARGWLRNRARFASTEDTVVAVPHRRLLLSAHPPPRRLSD